MIGCAQFENVQKIEIEIEVLKLQLFVVVDAYCLLFMCMYSRSAFVAGGFLVAQFVLIDLEPSHCPFMAVIALSASCNDKKANKGKE